MPRGNRQGPDGMGPMTGRGQGFCAGSDTPGFTQNFAQPRGGRGRGFGQGRGQGFGPGGGRGFGWARGFGNSMGNVPIQSEAMPSGVNQLLEEIRLLKEQIAGLEKRISETTE